MTLNPDAAGSCYNINGTLSPFDDITYVPCNQTAVSLGQHSACCAPGDKCLTNGLCQYPKNSQPYNEWWRVGCTDPTYKDPACPKQCAGIEASFPTHLVFQCPGDGKWCCATGQIGDFPNHGTVNTTCCSITDLAFDGEEAVEYATARAYIAVKTSSADLPASTALSSSADGQLSISNTLTGAATQLTGSIQATATQSAVTASGDDGGRTLAMGVGFGLGIPFAVCLIIGFIITCRRFERRAQQKHHAIPQETASVTYFAPPPAIKGFDISAPQSRDGMRDEPSAPPTGIAAFFRKLRHRRKRSESEEDLRRANPHAYRIEVGGRELPVELDTIKAPVEVWSPTGREKTDLKYTDFH